MNNDKQGHFFNHYDLWINNNLLRQGLQLVLDSLSPGCFHGKYVFSPAITIMRCLIIITIAKEFVLSCSPTVMI